MTYSESIKTRQETEEVAEMIPVADLPGAVDIILDTEDQSMIEDVNFTKRIVQVVADHPRFPARMTVGELAEELQLQPGSNDEEKLIYHLVCAYQAGLLHANYDTVNTLEGTHHVFGYIDGLTHIGSEYGHHMKGALWGKVIEWTQKQGIPLTTKVAVKGITAALEGGGTAADVG